MLEGAIAFLEQQQDDSGDLHDAATDATDVSEPELIKQEEYAGDVLVVKDLRTLHSVPRMGLGNPTARSGRNEFVVLQMQLSFPKCCLRSSNPTIC